MTALAGEVGSDGMKDLGERPSGFAVEQFLMDDPPPAAEVVEWLTGIAQRLQQPDGHISAMYHPARQSEGKSWPEEWRLVAYFGDAWERAGDGWRSVELNAADPVTLRDSTAVEALWRDAIEDSRRDHARRKVAAE